MPVTIYSKPNCPFCDRAKEWCRNHGVPYKEVDVSNKENLAELKGLYPEAKTVPQIFLDNEHIGGYSDLLDRQFYVLDSINA